MLLAAYYLPKECPLVDHLIESYFKHYDSLVKEVKLKVPQSSFVKPDDKLMRVKPEFRPIIDPKIKQIQHKSPQKH